MSAVVLLLVSALTAHAGDPPSIQTIRARYAAVTTAPNPVVTTVDFNAEGATYPGSGSFQSTTTRSSTPRPPQPCPGTLPT